MSAKGEKQFVEDFSQDATAASRWITMTGDGAAAIELVPSKGCASILVDATQDRRGIWWAVIKREITSQVDLDCLEDPEYELRIEALIRVSHAPRRVNLHAYNQKTTDHHSHLMEFDIPDTTGWHAISFTTSGFSAGPGDQVFIQLALMDWGLEKYRVDVARMGARVVRAASAEPDQGVAVPYHPPIADPASFAHKISAAADAMIDVLYQDVNFDSWSVRDLTGLTRILSVNGTQDAIMRWDLKAFMGKRIAGSGLLALTIHSVQRLSGDFYEFGKVRVVEILAGDPEWDRRTVTYRSLCRGQSARDVFNTQMIIDIDVTEPPGTVKSITIPNPVLQRLVDGKNLGIAARPLGAVNASFYATGNGKPDLGARLLFNVQG
jgi:hypothetical protein